MISIITLKKTSVYLLKWVLNAIGCLSHGQEFFLMVMKKHPMKRDYFYDQVFDECLKYGIEPVVFFPL